MADRSVADHKASVLPKSSLSVTSVNTRGQDDLRTQQAIHEGRRLYVGNLPYMAKSEDIAEFFALNCYKIEHMSMSTDPFTGRNTSFCFVELSSKSQADIAMQELNGKVLLGRPVKIGPGVATSKLTIRTRKRCSKPPVFQRWTRTDASEHFQGYTDQGRRVWVGGLPKMRGHCSVDAGIRELFGGFEIEAVSKVIVPKSHDPSDPKTRNDRYLFVDFPSAEEARRAVKATDGKQAWGVGISVRRAIGADSRKIHERDEWDRNALGL